MREVLSFQIKVPGFAVFLRFLLTDMDTQLAEALHYKINGRLKYWNL